MSSIPRTCAGCGEELLGSVNRCWKCGRTVAPGAASHEPGSVARNQIPEAVGGPTGTLVLPASAAVSPEERILHSAALSGVYGGTVMAAVSAVSVVFAPITALVTAVTGLGLATWGLYSPRRTWAAAVALVCLMILLVALTSVLLDVFVWVYGRGPFDQALEPELDA